MTILLKINMLIIWIAGTALTLTAQISPGKLTTAHKHLEGLANCTKCHVLGDKNTTPKCIECHLEIKNMIDKNSGYHASSEVRGKECHICHGEHFGRDFKIVRLDEKEFNHDLTGYILEGRHKIIKCEECHNPRLISSNISRKKENTYLGLSAECTACHEDYHQNTLKGNCISCHSQDVFSPAPGFEHDKTEFPLIGKHQTTDCKGCHAIEKRNGKEIQIFADIPFSGCTDCHYDVHMNKFGNDCRKCHNEFSFQNANVLTNFDHNLTNFPLNGMHRSVDCKQCHTRSYSEPLVHDRCINCHDDYHEKQFQRNGNSPDCIECHDVNGFSPSSFGIDKHTLTTFPLEGAHMATPCFSCHKENNIWKFINLQSQCSGCHDNVHENYLDKKFVSDGGCKICHNVSEWADIDFDHNKTNFELKGRHAELNCSECHFKQGSNYLKEQQFKWEQEKCTNCHTDIHYAQFDEHGKNDCECCHTFNNWLPEKFNHDESGFKLEGQHKYTDCRDCHATLVFSETKTNCIDCHGDMHANTVGPDCSRCHNSGSWLIQNVTDMHQNTGFPLLGAHNTAYCSDCHVSVSDLEFQPLSTECIACHLNNYQSADNPNHIQAGISTNCIECHKFEAFQWSAGGFNHDFFPLTKGHDLDNCRACHISGIFETLDADCYSCHKQDFTSATNPSHQSPGFLTSCLDCHTTEANWEPAKFDIHDTYFFPVFSGKHRGKWDECSDCHTQPENYGVFDCTVCHEHNRSEMDDKHSEVNGYIYNSVNCLICHPDGSEND